MKKSIIVLFSFVLVLFCLSCKSDKKPEKLKSFVSNVLTLDPEELTGSEPISQLEKIASQEADKIIAIDKGNMADALEEAKAYRQTIIIVGTHTLVKVKNLDDCQKSTSWGTCMPKGIGLTQRNGDFEKKTDYINNLIGKPDGQARKMYLFQ